MKKLFTLFLTLAFAVQFSVAQSDLVINEIMYNPPEAGTDSLEFIEIYNKGSIAINVNNYTCTGGIYTFPNVSINPGAYYVIAVDSVAFNNVYGLPADGQFTNGLNNGGESVVLKDDLGNILDSVLYDDFAPWPAGAAAGQPDGGGSSLILCDVNTDNNLGSNWQASTNSVGVTINGFPVLASPGAANTCSFCSPTFGIDPRTACDSLTWTNGVTYYANNFTAKDTLVNAAGCDSIVTLDLAVNYSSAPSTDTRTECDSLVWVDGITYFTNNTTATFTLTNQSGCDSVVTLNLTMLGNSSTGTDVLSSCDSLTWIDGNTYYSNNTTATHVIPNAVGCDSIITLNLTITNSYSVTDSIVACDSIVWIDGNTYTISNYTATHLLNAANGCDSLVTLNLSLGQTPDVTINNTIPDTACSLDPSITLPASTPVGGTYSGNGVTGNLFDPALAGIGSHTIYYTYSDSLGCTDIDSTIINVVPCVGISEVNTLSSTTIYPNPTNKDLVIDFTTIYDIVKIELINAIGQSIDNKLYYNTGKINYEIEGPKGIYFIKLTLDDKQIGAIRVLKN